ncbi:TatD family hydrolase [Candidatus Albibeggiatoa sp. nov. NOAA]|uniref:TatD family hydrolase n=1 Tax=Candidatus Albibeggiatoa sp. nov. NOAA TaxID=3162724 RepID=UPI0032F9991F|nr:TatD family hydrolase [Thiotrichaceae bacterium]
MQLIDTHIHFDDDSFDSDREAAYQRACDVGIKAHIVPAIHVNQWSKMREVCQTYPNLYPAYGLHPIFLTQHKSAHLTQLEQWIEQEKPIAVGECGLDFYLKYLDEEQQITFFTAQLDIAKNVDLPVILHARRSVDLVIKYIRRASPICGVVHSFVGSEQQAKQLIDLGFYLGFGGTITYERAKRLHRLIQALPLESILLETDAPDQPLSTHRGERNESSYLPEVLHTIASLRQQSPEDIAQITTNNAMQLFNFQL